MKLHFLLFAMLPVAVFAQDKAPAPTNEFAFNLGTAPDNAYEGFGMGAPLRGSISLLRSKGHLQYGATIEGGTNTNDQWYLAPGVVVNYRGLGQRGYWYGGAMAGYNVAGDLIWDGPAGTIRHYFAHGYTFGAQAGRVQHLGGRFSLSAEAGVRSTQMWHRYKEQFTGPIYGPSRETQVLISVPVTIGFRYRL